MTLFIHIGMGNAGSTLLQNVLASHVDDLAGIGIDYPELGRAGVNHHPLAVALTKLGGPESPLWAQFRDYVAYAENDVVLSSEAFEGVEPGALRRALGGVVPTRIVCYVRPQALRMPSFYSQNTKYGLNVADFDTFFDRIRPQGHRQWIYADFIRYWAEQFGPDRVRLRSLEERANLVADFLGACGIKANGLLSAEAAGSPSMGHPVLASKNAHSSGAVDAENLSPPWQLVEVIRDFHGRVTGDSGSMVARMEDAALWPYLQRTFEVGAVVAAELGWTGRGRYLSKRQFDVLDGMYRRDISNIRALGVDGTLSPPDYDDVIRDALPSVDAIPRPERTHFLERVSTELLRFQLQRLRS